MLDIVPPPVTLGEEDEAENVVTFSVASSSAASRDEDGSSIADDAGDSSYERLPRPREQGAPDRDANCDEQEKLIAGLESRSINVLKLVVALGIAIMAVPVVSGTFLFLNNSEEQALSDAVGAVSFACNLGKKPIQQPHAFPFLSLVRASDAYYSQSRAVSFAKLAPGLEESIVVHHWRGSGSGV
jgi:hypothetical protein